MARTNQEAVTAFGEVLRLTNSAYSYNVMRRTETCPQITV